MVLLPPIGNETSGWKLDPMGPATAEMTGGNIVQVSIPFDSSDRKTFIYVMDANCQFLFAPSNAMHVSVPQPRNHINGYNRWTTVVETNITEITNGAAWTELDTTQGSFHYCLRTELIIDLSGQTGSEVVHFYEHAISVTVNFGASFLVSNVDAERTAVIVNQVNTDYSSYVMAYECETGTEGDMTERVSYWQGDVLKICVKSKNDNIVQVQRIQSLSLHQLGGEDEGGAEFTYISGSVATSNEIAATDCIPGSSNGEEMPRVCFASVQLLGRFFEADQPRGITVLGSVKLSFSTEDGRRLTRTVDVLINRSDRDGLDHSSHRLEEEGEIQHEGPFFVTISSLHPLARESSGYFGAVRSIITVWVSAAVGAIILIL